MPGKPIWLDCDPGHDDAVAILLACHLPDIQLLGISTVHGNTSSAMTELNGARLLEFFAAPSTIDVWPGADHPLIRPTRADPEIHGLDGLGGGDALYGRSHEGVQARLARSANLKATIGMAKAVTETWKSGEGSKVTIVATGPLTNVALFFSVYPDLIPGVEEIVFMGGGVGLGNRSPVAEFNILCDPEAAQIVLNVPLPKVMVPLNLTHQAILTSERHSKLLDPSAPFQIGTLPPAASPLRQTLSSLLSFFAQSYKTTFGFLDGPPLHDVLTVAYVAKPELFTCTRYRVDVETASPLTVGETVVDLYHYQSCDDSWGRTGKNCLVAFSAQIPAVFDLILEAVARCDKARQG